MNKKIRWTAVFTAMAVCIIGAAGITGCSKKANAAVGGTDAMHPKRVVTTFTILQDMAHRRQEENIIR